MALAQRIELFEDTIKEHGPLELECDCITIEVTDPNDPYATLTPAIVNRITTDLITTDGLDVLDLVDIS